MIRIRFYGLALGLSARLASFAGHPIEIAGQSYEAAAHVARGGSWIPLYGQQCEHVHGIAAPCQGVAILLDCVEASRAAEAWMVPFFVQIKCKLGKSYEVANKLADAEIASEIYSTAGDFDLLVKFYV